MSELFFIKLIIYPVNLLLNNLPACFYLTDTRKSSKSFFEVERDSVFRSLTQEFDQFKSKFISPLRQKAKGSCLEVCMLNDFYITMPFIKE